MTDMECEIKIAYEKGFNKGFQFASGVCIIITAIMFLIIK